MKKWPVFCLAFVPFILAVSPSDPPPAPVPAVCSALAAHPPLIAGLQTGQAIRDGARTTLRFSSEVFACDAWTNEVKGGDCLDRWSFQLTIPNGSLVPGTYDLAAIGATYGDLLVRTTLDPDPGCGHACRTSVNGIGDISVEASEATLVIDSADDGCITGAITGLVHPYLADAPSFEGAFFAVACAP